MTVSAWLVVWAAGTVMALTIAAIIGEKPDDDLSEDVEFDE